ncbi:uncharacterized protein LOC114451387 [Parambassis ranga]|uniref:Uncharacterized protein LOC114451387 n=1 Tax=Parambassis ranga TaxID=210632 RepID=A0A6P7KEE1_9TELE|nr:uncharacterized protein LOC114451387 [Parambassis ranga]
MYLDLNLRIEVLSSLLGQILQPYDKKGCKIAADVLSVDQFHRNTIFGKRQAAYVKELFVNEEDFFDPKYDCDFTNLADFTEVTRGNEPYERPKGWYRMALKVRGKYPDGDTWLGPNGWRSHSAPGEWPVSYHGTSLDGAKGIIRSHYKAGKRAMYGRGIYSTPDIHVAEKEEYAKTFTSMTTGKSYKVILQNRVNPKRRKICQRPDYWLIPVQERTPAEKEKYIAESSIRPYGILIKEIHSEEDHSDDDDASHYSSDTDDEDDDDNDDADDDDADDDDDDKDDDDNSGGDDDDDNGSGNDGDSDDGDSDDDNSDNDNSGDDDSGDDNEGENNDGNDDEDGCDDHGSDDDTDGDLDNNSGEDDSGDGDNDAASHNEDDEYDTSDDDDCY